RLAGVAPLPAERSNDPPPAQPRRRPPAQPRPRQRRLAPPPTRPRDTRGHRAPGRRRQELPRHDPHPQALPRQPPLPRHAERHATDDLTVIGDSFSTKQSPSAWYFAGPVRLALLLACACLAAGVFGADGLEAA